MMTNKEYQQQLVRMWDSIRSDCKGTSGCSGVDCNDCHFDEICNAAVYGSAIINACKTIEIVEQWAEQHPIVTNADKFREVFGFKPYTKNCINGEEKVSCTNCQCFYDGECAAHNRFWNAEYKGKTEGCEEE